MKKVIPVIVAFALSPICAIANAQTAAPPAASGPTSNAPSATSPTAAKANAAGANQAMSSGGLRMADQATLAVRFVTVRPADFMASRLIGTTVYNNQNESIGEIEDLVVDNGRTVSGIVVSVGGFLGVGESHVALDPTSVVLSHKDNEWKAFVDTNKENLNGAPKFKYSRKK